MNKIVLTVIVSLAAAAWSAHSHAAQVQRIQLSGYDVPTQTGDDVVNVCFVEFNRNKGEEFERFAYAAPCATVLPNLVAHWEDVYAKLYGAVSITVSINGVSLSTM